jgi:molybdenum cofactor synthesis domain-containing protein
MRIDAGLAGTLAGQGIFSPAVYRKPLVAVISTGTEILEENQAPEPGRIYNSNRYSLQTACELAGCQTVYIGTAKDDADIIAKMIEEAFSKCDAVILSGGVSVGDFDCTPEAMEKAGVKKIRIHDLRHSHVAYLINQGVQPLIIKERLGHKDIKITLNTYGHLYPSQQKEVAEMMNLQRRKQLER